MIQGWKVLTHDLRPPVQGGNPVFDGALPCTLPKLALDESAADCGAGWNFCLRAADALRIGGLWPTGRPSRLFSVSAEGHIERGDKCRAAEITLVREATDGEFANAISDLSAVFRDLHETMISQQLAWLRALGRCEPAPDVIELDLRAALVARGLNWTLRRFDSAWAAWAALAAWAPRDAWAAWAALAAWAPRAPRAAWAALAAWAPRDAWAARDALAARDARAALTVWYASVRGWIQQPADMLTAGIRDAYLHGLAIVIPTGPKTLGYAIEVAGVAS